MTRRGQDPERPRRILAHSETCAGSRDATRMQRNSVRVPQGRWLEPSTRVLCERARQPLLAAAVRSQPAPRPHRGATGLVEPPPAPQEGRTLRAASLRLPGGPRLSSHRPSRDWVESAVTSVRLDLPLLSEPVPRPTSQYKPCRHAAAALPLPWQRQSMARGFPTSIAPLTVVAPHTQLPPGCTERPVRTTSMRRIDLHPAARNSIRRAPQGSPRPSRYYPSASRP